MLCHNVFTFLLLACVLRASLCQDNNVCPSYRDYITMKNNSNCWYNFAADLKVPEIIRRSGYPFIEYKVQTKDGYILSVFRIPSVQQKAPVFMLHGIQSTSGIFVGMGKHSLAFLLADAGYDVWLGNYRGTEYSEGHTHLNITQRDYWNYGVDEIALIDVPTMLNLVRYYTWKRGKIIYIGHSLGTSAAMMYACEYQEHAKETVKLFIFMAPAYKLNNMRSPYRVFFPLMRTALSLSNNLNIVQVFSRGYARRLTRPTCLAAPSLMLLCLSLVNLFLGPFTQISPETVPVLFNQLPGGTSLKTLTYLSEAVRGQFRKFDYGGRNLFMYGNSTPPSYNISRVEVPVFIFYASHDWATSKPDAINLYRSLPPASRFGIYEISNLRFNHFDFLFGKEAKTLVHDKILQVIENFPNKTPLRPNMFLVIVLLGCLIQNSLSEYNNVCPTFEDYYTMRNNSNCWYDFTAEFDVPTVIRLNGYPVIEYRVPTADGFILTMFRIPSKNPKALKYPVYLQHGLVATCAYFVGLKRNSLAFVLADAGYDVWLGNYRGTQYSETHINKTVYQQDYWDHSMDEIVAYDFPASFNTILANTDPDGKIIYIGHSLGTTLSLMYAAEFPEVAKETLRMMVLISPAYTLANMKSPYRLAAPFGAAIMNIVGELEMFRIVSQAQPLKVLTDTLCLESPPLMQFCLQLYNLFYGPHTDFGPEMIPVYFNQLPGGTALKILNHAADLVLGNFRKYNYVDRNVLYYGTEEPPEYDIKKIQVPVYIIYSSSDWATTAPDAVNLWNHLSEEARFGLKNVEVFNHIDFVYGRHARSLVYDDLVQVLNKFVNS
ncbi:uncharacterized protein LOC100141961 [Tribolium castaneum]